MLIKEYMPYRTIKSHAGKNAIYYSKRRPYGKYALAGAGALVTAKAAYSLAKKVKSMVNTEFKYSDVDAVLTNITATGQFYYLSGVAQGDGGSSRDGNQLRAKTLSLHGQINMNASSPSEPCIVRMVVFTHKNPQATAPSVGTLFENVAAPSVFDFYNLDEVPQNVRILKTKIIKLSLYNPINYINETIKLNTVLRYDGTGATVADQSSNAIYVAFFSNALNNYPDGHLSTRLRYVDN